jgi:hypothetical protein
VPYRQSITYQIASGPRLSAPVAEHRGQPRAALRPTLSDTIIAGIVNDSTAPCSFLGLHD